LLAAGRALVDFLLPSLCRVCGSRWPAPAAPPLPGLRWWDAAAVCPRCRPLFAPRPFRTEAVLPQYGGRPTDAPLAELVAVWKYRGARGATLLLGELAASALDLAAAELGPTGLLVPVPLHPRRRRERGFNQSELLARAAAGERRVVCDVLVRTRSTSQQAKLLGDDAERLRNVAGCFQARPAPPDAGPVVLVDDIVTSGATAGAAARALREAGWNPLCVVAAGLSARPATSS
jgi:predicted amidophosphoribosyltransferase